jgi:anti-sigma B factor antagonist
MALRLKVGEKSPGVQIVRPIGSLDTMTYLTLEDEIDSLLQKGPKLIIFDMKELEYISSSGVGAIIRARKMMKNHDGQVLLVNLQPQIEKVFEIIKALPDERIFKDVEELDRYLDRMQKRVLSQDE